MVVLLEHRHDAAQLIVFVEHLGIQHLGALVEALDGHFEEELVMSIEIKRFYAEREVVADIVVIERGRRLKVGAVGGGGAAAHRSGRVSILQGVRRVAGTAEGAWGDGLLRGQRPFVGIA